MNENQVSGQAAATASDGRPSAGEGAGETVLDVHGLSLGLATASARASLVEDVTFTVSGGEILGVVGESGSGKSLTALSVMRMLPTAVSVTGGRIRYRDSDLLGMPETDMMRLRGDRLGMVFQDPLAYLNPLMTVGQQIREVLVLHGMSKRQAAQRAVELLELVEVRDAANRVDDYPHQFSGGMRQRVIIAIAVANNPTLLIADEPTTALDVTVQAGILRLLVRLRDELAAALVLITHDIGIVEEVCDSVMVMYAGRVVEKGPVDEVLRDPRHPYTRELMRSTPRLHLPTQERLATIPGQPPDVTNRPAGCAFHPRCPLALDRCATDPPQLVDRGDRVRHDVACWLSEESLPAPDQPERSAAGQRSAARDDLILDIDDVHISHHRQSRLRRSSGERHAVDGVTLQAHTGRALGLVGESGCGKSTLARAILGLLPLRSGSISVAGKQWAHVKGQERTALRCTVQMVFQDPYLSLNPRQTVEEILTEPLVVHRLTPRSGLRSRVSELMNLVGLPDSLLGRFPYQLSGGQRQRVGIARALAVEPELIVADEPVSALDVSVQAQIINLLADLRDELGLAYLVIAHDLSVIRHLCEDVAVMQQGRIVEQGSVTDVFAGPQHPYTLSLLAASTGGGDA